MFMYCRHTLTDVCTLHYGWLVFLHVYADAQTTYMYMYVHTHAGMQMYTHTHAHVIIVDIQNTQCILT